MVKVKGKGYGIRLYSPYRRCWSPFLGPSARKCNGGLGAHHPVLSHTLPVYLPQISPGTHSNLAKLTESRNWPPSQTEELGTLTIFRGIFWFGCGVEGRGLCGRIFSMEEYFMVEEKFNEKGAGFSSITIKKKTTKI